MIQKQPSRSRLDWKVPKRGASCAKGPGELARAGREALRAHSLNPGETGALLLLAEIEMLRGNHAAAHQRLRSVVQTNHRAASAYFLLAYLDSRSGRKDKAAANLAATVQARGPEWKPKGSVNEGDVQHRMHEDTSLLGSYAEAWDGKSDPSRAFNSLSRRLASAAGR
ncbi:MAG: hypothetical protein JNL62_23405 [Bryobacterales bacterium]|nr:hypothetical protein [Bryobacterales bacterium]